MTPTLYQDPVLDYYGLDPEADPADSPIYSLSLFDPYETTDADRIATYDEEYDDDYR